jgi:FMN phosphatase YigB (HAD superfamily)
VNIRAAIFDVYGTLLRVAGPPADAPLRWEHLCRDSFQTAPRLNLEQFSAACARIIVREHETARARGIPHPEVYWPGVATEVLPELEQLSAGALDAFLFAQAQLWHTVQLAPGVASTLAELAREGVVMGIASNAQPYTLRELDATLGGVGLSRDLFQTSLSFWSFDHGFSKPDPHVFQILAARLAARGIAGSETCMIGDRLDHDIEPARAQGWHTWHIQPTPPADWPCLREYLLNPRSTHPS